MGDLWALVLAFAYVGAVVAVGEGAHRLGLSRPVARKVIHVGVGLWIIGTVLLFESRYLAAVPALVSVAANYVIHRRRLLGSVAAEAENLGTVWFPVSFALLVLFAWDEPAALVGGVLAMTVGDALASTVGLRWGRRQYATLGGRTKSLEGSLAMFGATLLTTLATLWVVAPPLPPAAQAGLAVLAAVAAACAESVGIKGRDNLWVPLGTGLLLWAGLRLFPHLLPGLGAGAALSAAIGLLAWWKRSLSPSGTLGAILTGTPLFGLGGWAGGLALVAFFVSGSALSHLFRDRKAPVEADFAKTGTRDLGQALANGGVAAAAAVGYAVSGDPAWMGAVLGGIAAASADTWATELGVLSRTAPRMVTTFREVPPGTSGAVSLTGTLAGLGGAALVGLVAALADPVWWRLMPWVAAAGIAGAFADSLLGATVQAVYWCPRCGKETERTLHGCGSTTRLHRGLPAVSNDLVNLAATLVGAAAGFLAV
ncbi:uncharacterized protein (TIGR00297 family) [Symbiobacterium terraclitae]|uniref:Uncharacterized protein (TIGR00297 family) n=1 Tax=Symbiobacterium terraclitae TaxID=557451 RepID=A0ABS4JXP1_9FIRM|nr:DUF92 domain-containing protein [Symbiobacterium terraclitae]MBP2019666.1 uncharacterized protein (TIGR00297 family) [Symbiobacterium terraclitae]